MLNLRFILMPALLFGLALFCSQAQALSSISIEIAQVDAARAQLRDLKLNYSLKTTKLTLQGRYKLADDQDWTQADLSCTHLRNPANGSLQCAQGKLTAGMINLPFSLKLDSRVRSGVRQLSAELGVKEASFSDAKGLRAGEKISATFNLKADQSKSTRLAQSWRWQFDANWLAGEVFWQPFYITIDKAEANLEAITKPMPLSAGHQLSAKGTLSDQFIKIDAAKVSVLNVGSVELVAEIRRADRHIQKLNAVSSTLDLSRLYPMILKPLLDKTAMSHLEMAGKGDFSLTMRDGEMKSAQLNLQQADIEDMNGRFAIYKVNASLPWDYDQLKTLKLTYEGGHLLKLPLGKTDISAALNRYSLTAPVINMPILDGSLNLKDISAAWVNKGWHWNLRANLVPISMVDLSHALDLPLMQGKVDATIPLVTYSNGSLITDGDMQFNLFDGSIIVSNLGMQMPLGIAPRLSADLKMRNLDLGILTRTFSFGAIEGKLDGDVNNLRLANWQPVNFDAAFYSSPGKYRKKISQRAVENISSLGGAGASAAIQRSVLRFFDDFNYAKLGLNCKLRNDSCEMSGIESTSQGYVIVKGSGIPSITVLGYNRNVSWGELLERIQRVTAGNSKPIIK